MSNLQQLCVILLYFSFANGYIPIKVDLPGMILKLNVTIERVNISEPSKKEAVNRMLSLRQQDFRESDKQPGTFIQTVHQWKNIGLYSMDKSFVVDYFRASHWGKKNPSCDGHRQSPIDINPQRTQRSNERIWYNMDDVPKEMMIVNNGNTVQLIGNWEQTPYLLGPGILPYKRKYVFSDATFHWSRRGNGSEHAIKGKRFVLEVQLNFFKAEGNVDIMDAVDKDDHMAMMSVLYTLSSSDNEELVNVLDGFRNVEQPRTMNKVTPFPLKNFLPKEYTYYVYSGSITVPPCTETVTWLIFEKQVAVSTSQMDIVRKTVGNNNEVVITNSRILTRRMYG